MTSRPFPDIWQASVGASEPAADRSCLRSGCRLTPGLAGVPLVPELAIPVSIKQPLVVETRKTGGATPQQLCVFGVGWCFHRTLSTLSGVGCGEPRSRRSSRARYSLMNKLRTLACCFIWFFKKTGIVRDAFIVCFIPYLVRGNRDPTHFHKETCSTISCCFGA